MKQNSAGSRRRRVYNCAAKLDVAVESLKTDEFIVRLWREYGAKILTSMKLRHN